MIGRPDMELPSDTYLHDRLRDIASNPRSMLLQVQLRAEDPDNGDLLNPTLAWDCTAYPWQDVAQIHLTNCTPKACTERAKYNFNKTPEDVELVVPEMGDSFAGLVQVTLLTLIVYPESLNFRLGEVNWCYIYTPLFNLIRLYVIYWSFTTTEVTDYSWEWANNLSLATDS